jgi:uncharacterized protein YndB with AHSA1/START domain
MQDVITKTIDLDAPIERVWRALTDHREFGDWFRVGESVKGKVLHPGYEHITFEATVTAMEAPRLFAFEGHPGGHQAGVDDSDTPTTRAEFRLEPLGQGTRLTVVESGFAGLPPQTREATYRGNEAGWELQLENIRAYLAR